LAQEQAPVSPQPQEPGQLQTGEQAHWPAQVQVVSFMSVLMA
jgi:hypothetical protein